jgi:hypothetical protein
MTTLQNIRRYQQGGLALAANQTYEDPEVTVEEEEVVASPSPRAAARLTAMLERLRNERAGPSESDKWWAISSALARPTTSGGRFGQTLSNIGEAMTGYSTERRKAEQEKSAMISKYELGLAELEDRAESAKAQAAAKAAAAGTKPLKITQGLDDNDVPYVIETYSNGVDIFRRLNPDGTHGAVIPPPARATAAPSALTGVQVAAGPRTLPAPGTSTERPSAPRTGVAVGATFRGVDGKLYVKTATGQREVEGASPEFEAERAEKLKLAEKGAEAKVDLQKEAEVKSSAARMSQLFIDDSTKLIESGQIITGLGANVKLQALRARAAMKDEAAAAQVVATETFQINAANQVLSIIKNFGTGSAVSDADRAYATKMAGGDISLNEGSLARILKILTASNNYAQSEAKRLGGVGTRPTVASGAYRYDASGKRVPDQ